MIPERAIREWNVNVPWQSPLMVEQDLIIARALVGIFSDEYLRENLAFRGGTALHKLYLQPQPRYSEDIDLVQINPGPIKETMYRLGEVMSWLPNRSTAQKRHSNKMFFKFESEVPPVGQMRLKIEINCFEHFSVLGFAKVPFKVENSWFTGEANITTYQLAELLGTKMRALYQRKKGRDLLDLYFALTQTDVDANDIVRCYRRYISFVVKQPPTYKQFIINMEQKMQDSDFLNGSQMFLRPDIQYNPQEAYEVVRTNLIDKLLDK